MIDKKAILLKWMREYEHLQNDRLYASRKDKIIYTAQMATLSQCMLDLQAAEEKQEVRYAIVSPKPYRKATETMSKRCRLSCRNKDTASRRRGQEK